MRTFFKDCQEWEWIARCFNPHQVLRTPASIYKLIGRDPRVIDDDIWAKLLWAGLNLTEDDLPKPSAASKLSGRRYYYPIEMMRAIVIVWLFAGMRGNELRRLRLGCIRWQGDYSKSGELLPENTVCLLSVPTGKTSPEFVKPVDRVVGEAIEDWERVRTATPLMFDQKTSEMVSYLFAYRTKPVGRDFINRIIIPMLCRKAGIPEQDARGNITGHRARSTIATQLSNSMSLLQLMKWLGHSNPETTLFYVQTSILKLADAYKNSKYLERNVRTAGIAHNAIEPSAHSPMADGEVSCGLSISSVVAKLMESKRELVSLLKTTSMLGQQTAIEGSIKAVDDLCAELLQNASTSIN
jgi:integrase